ncbi:hypothetical protein I601_3590 [Nocardioides dokdonensis FR1436]|uniref:DUF3093 domain-containing protein n=1 Tax=Nocardioides dokdonensis FR1436 TaxID=1300347 RepID=A0A1A9GPI4_9ACTN|nr:DUF3093 domain-containing protein [Nocardioides dokdonensis]ANH39996.1 hypothetical protein I601_3590 [Nocardioides dokdonensis FR1436]
MDATSDYRERLSVPLRWWVQGTMLVASLWLAVVVAVPEPLAWSVTAVAVTLMTVLLVRFGSPVISVSGGVLRAGRARIDVAHLGAVEALDADAARRAAGVDADARAYLLLRPYRKQAVRVQIEDPADPTPYWLLSTRRPTELAAALSAASPRVSPPRPSNG